DDLYGEQSCKRFVEQKVLHAEAATDVRADHAQLLDRYVGSLAAVLGDAGSAAIRSGGRS
ncbi:MAG: hypothetical protein VW554_06655, partial [Alphaproteobacteria bacterium]